MRRALIITAVLILLIGIAIAVYFYFFASKPTISTGPGTLPSAGTSTTIPGSGTGQGAGGIPTPAPVTVAPRLVRISAGPVVPGPVVLNRRPASASSSPQTVVQYLERQNGNMYSYLPATKTLTRISNKTIPGVMSAKWLPDGSVAYLRYLSGNTLSTINTYALSASTSASSFFLAQNLTDLAVSSTSILSLASGVNGSVASLMRTDGSGSSNAFSTPLSSIRLSFAGKQYLVFTKPSGLLAGNAFLVDATGHFNRVAGPKNGLVALGSPQGAWALVSYTAGSSLKTELVNLSSGETLPLPVSTIADKCVWSADDSLIYCGVPHYPPSSLYPDDWYQGAAHFSDRIWKIQVSGRYAQMILDFSKETKDRLDAYALAVDPSNSELVFVNKNDGSLWGYSL